MSSVTRFLRQVPTGLSAYNPGVGDLTPDSGKIYALVPGQGNYVGNYASDPNSVNPGYMVKINPSLVNGTGTYIFRDMGKTTFARVSALGTGADLSTSTPGYFRAIQILSPTGVAFATAPTNFGVQGQVPGTFPLLAGGGASSNPGDMGYNTFYVPIVVGGVVATTNASSPGAVGTPILASLATPALSQL